MSCDVVPYKEHGPITPERYGVTPREAVDGLNIIMVRNGIADGAEERVSETVMALMRNTNCTLWEAIDTAVVWEVG